MEADQFVTAMTPKAKAACEQHQVQLGHVVALMEGFVKAALASQMAPDYGARLLRAVADIIDMGAVVHGAQGGAKVKFQ